MIFLIPLRDRKLFKSSDIDQMTATDIVTTLRAEPPTLFTAARVSVTDSGAHGDRASAPDGDRA